MEEEQLPQLSLDDLEPREYEPNEVAKILGISKNVLRKMRQNGKILGRETKNNTKYTVEQIRAANLEKDKPGPKAGEGSRRGRAKYVWPGDEGTTGKDSSSVASSRHRRQKGPRTGQLVAMGA
jgi:hypothetical protein